MRICAAGSALFNYFEAWSSKDETLLVLELGIKTRPATNSLIFFFLCITSAGIKEVSHRAQMDLLHRANKPNHAVFLLCIFTIHDSDDSGTHSCEEENNYLLIHM